MPVMPCHEGIGLGIGLGIGFTKKESKRKKKKPPGDFRVASGECGIRTHVPLRTTAFRVRRVTTTSLTLRAEAYYIGIHEKGQGKIEKNFMSKTFDYSGRSKGSRISP